MYTNPQCQWNSKATTFFGNQRYTCTRTKTMYDIFGHRSLPTSAILALGLLKKKEEETRRRRRGWTIFAWAAIMHFRISGASQAHFSSFKGCYQHGYYCRERLYSQSAWKCEIVKKNRCFHQDCLWDAMGHVFSRSCHSCKLICKCSSSIHNSSFWWVNDILTQRR